MSSVFLERSGSSKKGRIKKHRVGSLAVLMCFPLLFGKNLQKSTLAGAGLFYTRLVDLSHSLEQKSANMPHIC